MIVILSGGFDPIHIGHVRMFKNAKKIGKVIVGLNSDEWLIRKKGRPFMRQPERKEILDAIKYIDEVWYFNDDDESCCDLITTAAARYGNDGIIIGNGGDRIDSNTSVEYEYCKQHNIDMIWDLGGGKVQSSSWLIKN